MVDQPADEGDYANAKATNHCELEYDRHFFHLPVNFITKVA